MKEYFKQLIEESLAGYAYHRIICDEEGKPCDYEIVEVNAAFELLTLLSGSDLIGREAAKLC